MITDKQKALIVKLLDERRASLNDAQRAFAADATLLERLSLAQASKVIETLLAMPRPEPAAGVPEGRYAIEHEGTLKFYHVRRPAAGGWAGRVFIDVQASDELHPIRSPRVRGEALRLIAVDPAGAARRYGREIGVCAVCGRTLTDEESRAYGIGPVCREKTGW